VKICNVCGVEKEKSKFDEYRYTCRQCRYKQRKERLIKRGLWPKKRKPRKDKKTEEEKKETQRQYYLKNRGQIKAKRAEYAKNNKEKISQTQKKYYRKNIEKIRDYHKEYRKNNKEKIRIEKRKYQKKKMKTDPSFRIRRYVRNSIYCALIRNNSLKNNLSILKFLPYSMKELKLHLESQFEYWMTWDNWGVYDSKNWDDNNPETWTWQLDHIIPQSYFHYKSMEDDDFIKCWSLDNLRPYSAKFNSIENTLRSRKCFVANAE